MACTDVQTIQAGNGSKTNFSFDFPYIFKSEIHVYFWNVTTKEYDEILEDGLLSDDAYWNGGSTAYPWTIDPANPTIVEFTGAAPPAPAAPTDPNESTVDNVKIRRITKIDDIRALFNPGSAIRSDDLNKNFEQLRYGLQEANCQDVPEEIYEFLEDYHWDNYNKTVYSSDTWDSSDAKIATTAAMDARFQDQANEKLLSTDIWASDDNRVPTTLATDNRVDEKIDTAITGDILIENNGLTKSTNNGQVTLGIGANSVDLDRIKDADIITSTETWANSNTQIATTEAIDNRIDEAIDNDVLVDSSGLTKTSTNGQVTLGIGAGSVDLDRIKADDIITYTEQNLGVSPADTNIFTASAAARRFDTLVTTSSPSGADWQVGKTWLQNDGDRTLSIWDGSEWIGVASGGVFNTQPKVVYVDAESGDNTSDGHRVSTPKASIKAAIEQINAEISVDVTNPGSGYADGSYPAVSLTGGGSTGLTADIVVSGGIVTSVTINNTTTLEEYGIGDVLSASDASLGGGGGSGLEITVEGDGDGQVVILSPGVYQEVAPIQIKRRNVTIIGQSLRSCIIHPTPATQTNTLFEVNSGTYISNVTFTGVKAGTGTGNTLDPLLPVQQGWNVAFYSGARILKSPYIQNCTNFSDSEIDNNDLRAHNPRGGSAGDLDSLPTGGGLLVNGATVSSDSPLRSIVCDSYTHVGLNGPGILVTNNGYVQATSSYAFFNRYHIKCKNGGQANLAASTTDFGEKALVADGRSSTAIFSSTVTTAVTASVTAPYNATITIDAPTADASWHGSATRPQPNMVLDVVDTNGTSTYEIVSATANGTGWDVVVSRPDPTDRSVNLGIEYDIAQGATIDFYLRSMIASSGHTMEYVGSGTDYRALPENGGLPVPANETEELGDGKIWAVTVNDKGTLKAGGTFEINQQTGEVTIPSGGAQLADYVKQTNLNGEAKLPAGSTGQRTASPLAGHIRFNTSTVEFEGYNGSTWSNFALSAGTSAPEFLESPTTLTTDKIIPANINAAVVGPIAIDATSTITINNGSKLTVLS